MTFIRRRLATRDPDIGRLTGYAVASSGRATGCCG